MVQSPKSIWLFSFPNLSYAMEQESEEEDEQRGIDIILVLTNPEEAFREGIITRIYK